MALFGFNSSTADAMVDIFYTAAQYGGESYALAEFGTDTVFACASVSLSHYIKRYSAVYHYEFDDPNAPQDVLPPVSFAYGSYHGSDVQYILDSSSDGQAPFSSAQLTLAERMKNYWANFARNANPNGTGLPVWPAYFDAPLLTEEGGPNMYFELSTNPRPFNSREFITDHGCLLFGLPYSPD